MGTIVPFFSEAAFQPEETALMSIAYEKACIKLHDRGQPALVNEIIAKRIIALMKAGERDADVLCDRALAAIGLPLDRAL